MNALTLGVMLVLSGPLQAASFTLDTKGGEPLYQTTLSQAVYQASRSDTLQDLRVYNAAGEQVPYALLEDEILHPTQLEQASTPLVIFPMQEEAVDAQNKLNIQIETRSEKATVNINNSDNNTLKTRRYLFDLGEKHPTLNKLNVDWQGAEGRLIPVEVLSSRNLKDWQPMGEAVLYKSSSADKSILQNSIALDDPTENRYLQLRIGEANSDIKLTSVNTEYSKTQTAPRPYVWQDLTFLSRTQSKAGEINLDFESLGRYPASQIKIALPQQNTITHVRVLVRNTTDAPWREISVAALYRLSQQGTERINADIVIHATVARYWRLQFNQTSGGLGAENPTLTLGWRPQTLVFNARGPAPYHVTVGEAGPMANALNIASLIPDYTIEKVHALPQTQFIVSPHTQDQPANATSAWESPPDYKRYLLWAGLGLGVLMLAGMVRTLLNTKTK